MTHLEYIKRTKSCIYLFWLPWLLIHVCWFWQIFICAIHSNHIIFTCFTAENELLRFTKIYYCPMCYKNENGKLYCEELIVIMQICNNMWCSQKYFGFQYLLAAIFKMVTIFSRKSHFFPITLVIWQLEKSDFGVFTHVLRCQKSNESTLKALELLLLIMFEENVNLCSNWHYHFSKLTFLVWTLLYFGVFT